MKSVIFKQFPLEEKTSCGLPIPHDRWFRAQFRYFKEDCKLGREKNIEDYILNNARRVHFYKDNPVFNAFLEQHPEIQVVPIEQAELLVITHQGFSRLDTSVIVNKLKELLTQVPKIYLCLNKHYINYNDATVLDNTLPDDYNYAITTLIMTLKKIRSSKLLVTKALVIMITNTTNKEATPYCV